MKVLMFGWEFPPHILGGLGTASYGLTKGLAAQGDINITFCLPAPHGDEDKSFLDIIAMNHVPVVWRDIDNQWLEKRLGGQMSTKLYYDLRNHIYSDFSYIGTNDIGAIEFSGRYPNNLHDPYHPFQCCRQLDWHVLLTCRIPLRVRVSPMVFPKPVLHVFLQGMSANHGHE